MPDCRGNARTLLTCSQMAAREIIAAHGHDVEPYEFWIAASLGCALYTQDAFERWPSIMPKAWHPISVKPKVRSRHPAHSAQVPV